MIPALLGGALPQLLPVDSDPAVLVVVSDPAVRFAMASELLDAGFLVTASGEYGVVELIQTTAYDLLVTAQSVDEMIQFGVPQLARSIHPHLPILVLEIETACGEGMLDAVHEAIDRWPTRDRQQARPYH